MRNLLLQNNSSGKTGVLWQRFIVLFFARGIPILASLGVIWYLSVKLPVADYGLYQSCWLNISLLSVIGSFGLPVLLLNKTYLYALLNQAATKRTIIGVLVIAQLASIVYLIGIHALLSPQTLFALISIIVFQSIALIYESVYLALEKQLVVLIANMLYAVAFAGWHYYVVQTGYSLPLLLYGLSVMSAVKLLSFILLLKRQPTTTLPVIDNKVFFQNWLLLGFNEIVSIFSKWIDKIVIFFLLSSAEFGYYFNGAYEIPLFGMLVTIAGNILVVSFSKADNTTADNIRQFRSVTMMLSSIVFPVFAFLFFYHRELFSFLFEEKFDNSIPVFLISLFVLPVRITYYTAALQVRHKSRIILFGSILDIIAFIVFCLALYPLGGVLMIPLSLVLSTYVQAGYYLVCTSRELKTPVHSFFPLISLLGKLLICFAVSGAVYFLLPAIRVEIKIAIGLAGSAIIILTLLFLQIKNKRQQAV